MMRKRNMNFILFFLALFFYISTAQAGETVCVAGSRANLRAGPSTRNKLTWSVYQYFPFKKVKEEKGWYLVQDVDGDLHWVLGKLTTSQYKCAVTKNDKTIVKFKPSDSAGSPKWSPVKKYYSVRVLKIDGEWVHIQDGDGDKAWIKKTDLWMP